MSPLVPELGPLVAAAAAGDRDAFAEIVHATSGVVSSIALAIVGDLDASRDIAQDVFLAAWRDLKKLRNPASFLPWLRQMTRNRAHHVLRTHIRAKRHRADVPGDELLELVIDPRPDASAALSARQEAAALAEAIAALPEDTREVLTLFYREGQSVAQVAALLELTDAAVRKRLSRARDALRESVLDRAADTLKTTAPGAAFVSAVVTAISAGAPATASATTLAATKTILNAGLGAKVLFALLGAMPGAAGGVGGILVGARCLIKEARDEEELRGVRRYRLVSALTVAALAFSIPLGELVTGSRWWMPIDFGVLVLALAWQQHVWLPRIIGRRLDAEMREDPVAATARRRRERRMSILGWCMGLGFGGAAVIYSMLHH